jgi:hypothetical protein
VDVADASEFPRRWLRAWSGESGRARQVVGFAALVLVSIVLGAVFDPFLRRELLDLLF